MRAIAYAVLMILATTGAAHAQEAGGGWFQSILDWVADKIGGGGGGGGPAVTSTDAVSDTINLVTGAARRFAELLEPVGLATLYSGQILLALGVGLSIASGAAFLVPIMRLGLLGSGVGWAIKNWSDIVSGTLAACDKIIALILPGWEGPTTAFTMTAQIAGRMMASWPELDNPVTMMINAVYLGIAGILISLMLAGVSILVLAAKCLLVLGLSLAPLVLPFIVIPGFIDVGMGPIRYLIRGSISYIGCASVAALMIQGVMATTTVGGVDVPMSTANVNMLMILSLLGVTMTWAAGSIGGQLVGGGGISGASVGGMLGAGGAVVGGAVSVGSAAAGSVKAAGELATKAGSAMRSGGGSMGTIKRSSGTGSAFDS